MTNNNHNPDWYEDRVEAYIDGDLSTDELARFEERLGSDTTLQQSVNDARAVVSVLRTARAAECPDDLTLRVLQQVREAEAAKQPAVRADRSAVVHRLPLMRRVPMRTVAVAAAACLAALLFLKQPNPPAQTYSEAEVQQALREAKYALAIVSNASRETVRTIRMDAMPVVNEAFDHVLNENDGNTKTPRENEIQQKGN